MGDFRCPSCTKGTSTVLDTRQRKDGIRRRRKCYKCGHRFWTVEVLAPVKAEKPDRSAGT